LLFFWPFVDVSKGTCKALSHRVHGMGVHHERGDEKKNIFMTEGTGLQKPIVARVVIGNPDKLLISREIYEWSEGKYVREKKK
jgi:hypothetical protein